MEPIIFAGARLLSDTMMEEYPSLNYRLASDVNTAERTGSENDICDISNGELNNMTELVRECTYQLNVEKLENAPCEQFIYQHILSEKQYLKVEKLTWINRST